MMKNGKASGKRLCRLRQKERELEVPASAHPATMKKVDAKQIQTSLTSFFASVNTVPSPSPAPTVRICTDSEEGDGECDEDDTVSDEDDPTATASKRRHVSAGLRICPQTGFPHDREWFVTEYGDAEGEKLWSSAEHYVVDNDSVDKSADKSATHQQQAVAATSSSTSSDSDIGPRGVPIGEESRINRLMHELNSAYSEIPPSASRLKSDVVAAYKRLLKRPGWDTRTAKSHYPIDRFQRYLDLKFPEENNMWVSPDRLEWKCTICQGVGQDLRSGETTYHKQNQAKHFRSKEHCKMVASKDGSSAAVNAIVNEARDKARIFREDLPRAILDDAIISCARKSLSFTALPVVLSVAARAMIACRGTTPVPEGEIMKVSKVSKLGAAVLRRINAATAAERVRNGRTRPACVRSRQWVTDRMLQLGELCLKKKTEFLLKCPFLGCACDESDTYSFSAPLAAALQGCSWDFEWGNLFMGQSDVVDDKSGEGCFASLRSLLNGIDMKLLPLIVFLSTDGASAMRSTPMYAGLDSNPSGKSMHAAMKRALSPKLPNLHCLNHQADLALKKALKICVAWSDMWLCHVKGVYTWFSKSPSRKSALKSLHKEMELLNDVVTWRMVYPKYYCPTRWLGISRALKSLLAVADLLDVYVEKLVVDGYRPFRPYRAPEEDVPPAEAAHARQDEDEDDVRVHAAGFHQWGDEEWDLRVTPPQGDVRILDEDDILDLETGCADTWKDLATGNKRTRCKLVSEKIGLTAYMYGLDSIMADALEPYKMFAERLQTQTGPIGHRLRSWITNLFKELHQMFLSVNPRYGPHFQKWVERDDVSDRLADQVRAAGRSFVYHFLHNLRYRYQPYWKLILAMETINPVRPAKITPCASAWEGVRDLVDRCMKVDAEDVVADLQKQQDWGSSWTVPEVKSFTSNLLKFYHDRHIAAKRNKKNDYALASRFARLVFSIHGSSSIIETYFSKTNYIKSLHRASMRDSLASATMHLQQMRPYKDDDVIETVDNLCIDTESALLRIENDLDEYRKKYLHARVSKPFRDESTGNVRPYKGTVNDVKWDNHEGCILFHVDYDSDDDVEDMEHWELKKYVIS